MDSTIKRTDKGGGWGLLQIPDVQFQNCLIPYFCHFQIHNFTMPDSRYTKLKSLRSHRGLRSAFSTSIRTDSTLSYPFASKGNYWILQIQLVSVLSHLLSVLHVTSVIFDILSASPTAYSICDCLGDGTVPFSTAIASWSPGSDLSFVFSKNHCLG